MGKEKDKKKQEGKKEEREKQTKKETTGEKGKKDASTEQEKEQERKDQEQKETEKKEDRVTEERERPHYLIRFGIINITATPLNFGIKGKSIYLRPGQMCVLTAEEFKENRNILERERMNGRIDIVRIR